MINQHTAKMKNVTLLDGTQLPVLGLGTATYGGASTADYSNDHKYIAIMREIIQLGYTHLDTAEYYGRNHCEEIVGQAIKAFDRDRIFVTTKVSPEHFKFGDVINAAEGSLRRLDINYIDLYLLHWPNPNISLEETCKALNFLLADGRIRRIGVSNFSVEQLRRAMQLCDGPVITNQVHYNLQHREPEKRGLLKFCQDEGVILTAYSPLKNGVLDHPLVQQIAKTHHATPAQVAIQWLISIPSVVTIPRTKNPDRACENLKALELSLTDEEVHQLNEIG